MDEIWDIHRQLAEEDLTPMERALLEQTLHYLTAYLVDLGDGWYMSQEELEEQTRWKERDDEGWTYDEGFDLGDEI